MAVENPAFLRLDKTRLLVRREGQPTGIVPLEDLAVLILDYNEIAITLPLLAALAEAEVAVIICGTKHLPVATYLPFAAHHQHTRIVLGQASAGEPTKKRIWQQIVQAKVRNQGAVVNQVGPAKGREPRADEWRKMAGSVQSGDPRNVEATAAAKYFPLVFGNAFLRDPQLEDLGNSMLNYGYALIRAAVTRAVCAAGLHPAFGVFHHNRYDPYALADDAMEPLRPLVDLRVRQYLRSQPTNAEKTQLTPSDKRYLYPLLTATVSLDGERWPLFAALESYAANLRRCILSESKKLHCPIEFSLAD